MPLTQPLVIIDDATMAMFRSIDEGAMPSECDLIGFDITRSPGGVSRKTPVLLATVQCRLSNVGASLPQLAAQPVPDAAYRLAVPIATDLARVEHAIVRGTSFGVAWGVDLHITGILEPRTYASSHRMLAELATETIVIAPYPSQARFPSPTLYPKAA